MINKNEWSLVTYTEKDINNKILRMSQTILSEQDYSKMLSAKQSYERDGLLPKPQIVLKVLNCKVKRAKQQDQTSNLCASCYEHLPSQKHWCRICGNSTCKKCLVRQRQLKDQTRTFFCQKCDLQYLQAMSGITFYNKLDQLQRAFDRLVKQQESIDELVGLQKSKLLRRVPGSATSDLIERANRSLRLSEQNKMIKTQCQQLQKKVEFGKSINKDLKKKLHSLRKKQKESFGTLSNNDQYHSQIQPPKIDLDMSLENIRDSVLTTEEKREDLSFMDKCKCAIY